MSDDSESGKKGRSQATMLLEVAAIGELWHSPAGQPFASVPIGTSDDVAGHLEHHPVRSAGYRAWLAWAFSTQYGSAPSSKATEEALRVIEGRALYEGQQHHVSVRVGEHAGAVYLDLCDPRWRAVEVTPEGWCIVKKAPVRFRRGRGMLALPEPVAGGSLAEWRTLWPLLDDDAWQLLVIWLVNALRPSGGYPVLGLHGEQGSTKTTLSTQIRQLIDPNKAPVRSPSREERDLVVAAANSWILALNNVSAITPEMSDALCRISTDGGYAVRTNYSDDDETIFDGRRPVVLNGIGEPANRPDLIDRLIIVELPRVPEAARRTEEEVEARYLEMRPRLLGALLDAVVCALRRRDEVRIPLPRMASTLRWATAAEPALGWPEGTASAAYAAMRARNNDLAIEASPVAGPVRELVAASGGTWSGDGAELLEALRKRRPLGEKFRAQDELPKTPRGLRDALARIAPNLRAAGLEVDMPPKREGKDNKRMIHLRQAPGGPTAPGGYSRATEATDGDRSKLGIRSPVTPLIN